MIDPDYPWMELAVYSLAASSTEADRIESKIIPTSPVTTSIENISVIVDNVSFNVPYTTTGMTITGIDSDTESMSLIFFVDVTDPTGKLNVEFDRTFFDSIYAGVDDSFFILADGDETISREIQKNSHSRTLSIDVPSGTEELEVIGSIFDSSNVIEIPTIEIPTIEIPTIEIPTIEIPTIEIPTIEIPTIEIPTIEIPTIETTVDSYLLINVVLELFLKVCICFTNQCGPGTILEGDVCVLDQRCGPGTILEGDVCVLDSVSNPSPSKSSGTSKELITSFTVALVIAGIVGIILALIAKANKTKN